MTEEVITHAMANALEQLAKCPAVKGNRTGMRKIEFRTAARLIGRGLATLDQSSGAITISPVGLEALERARAGWR